MLVLLSLRIPVPRATTAETSGYQIVVLIPGRNSNRFVTSIGMTIFHSQLAESKISVKQHCSFKNGEDRLKRRISHFCHL